MAVSTPIDGTIHQIPFQGGSLVPQIVTLYEDLAEKYGSRNVLVLKRLPAGVDDLTQSLTAELENIGVPQVQSIAYHARGVLERETDLDLLSYEERIEFLAMVIESHNWDNEYFEGPAELDSFGRDMGRILMDATWQGGFRIDDSGEYDRFLTELKDINQHFHNQLLERGLIEQAMVVSTALEQMEDDTLLEQVQRAFDAVIAVEFEEFNHLERSYLARLTDDIELVCLAEEDSSIERVWSETGQMMDATEGLTPPEEALEVEDSARNGQSRVSKFLATGEDSALEGGGTTENTYLIREQSFEEQLQTVANEIEYLRDQKGWEYNDFAVLLKDSNAPIGEARHVLQHAGLPVASSTVAGLDQDRAVRELHAVADYALSESQEAEVLLRTRLDITEEMFHEFIDRVENQRSVEAKIQTWIRQSNLKHRIASDEPELIAKNQFAHIKKLLQIASFIDRSDFLDSHWSNFISMLERTITDYAPSNHSSELDVEEGGVMVDTVNILKNEQRNAVFLLNVVEGEYPAQMSLTPLFPRSWLKRMSGYPNVTNVDQDTVEETFSPAVANNAIPILEYYRQLDRRKLAIGARSAGERLYFCSHRSDSDSDQNYHPSRYLQKITDQVSVPQIGTDGHQRELYTTGKVSRRVLEQPWGRLEAVRAAASTGEKDIAIEDTEQLFGAIQKLLASDDVDQRFVDAVHRQIEMARGEVGN